MTMRNPLILILWLITAPAISQSKGEPNWYWWCDNVDCNNGGQHWSRYIITSPGYMGPNALPVPEVSTGLINNGISWEMTGMAHFSPGDKTQNLFTELKFNLAPDIVSMTISYFPFERFVMTPEIRDGRMVSGEYYEGQGTTHGDIYFGFDVQILKNKPKWPDMAARIMVKTAAGSEFGAARYTDAPGYFLDASFGKTYSLSDRSTKSIRPYIMLGFFAWQVNEDENRQNDAFMAGLGADLQLGKLGVHNSIGGYNGYKGNGDQPLVYRAELSLTNKRIEYFLRFQEGLRDFDYHTTMAGIVLKWNGSLSLVSNGISGTPQPLTSNSKF